MTISTPTRQTLKQSVCRDRQTHKNDARLGISCDIFGSDALCAAHCILIGHRGGWCDSHKVCHCRD
ncbi:unnamed protein product [Acanthoscelides obtectus]|uniref:Invertebrate defensins family profile domain-containing protein n=1 Tax=Acanthoscelides obtectus TaxID=200917 RepID=A0A9P0JWR3_ACAOB|nr:unnamed protein product [Acanthoscelides obtectus]CAK1663462.1 hypothetical protein AOBTE_LOCUS23680 [Acanthoscelides obtectus]